MNDKDIYKDAQKLNLITLLRTFKKEGLENFIVIRRNKFENLLKENEELKTMLKNRIKYTNELEQDLFENASNYVVPIAKIKEIVDKCVPRGKNIITDEEEYQPNTNANSFLTHEILKLLEECDNK